MTVRLRPASPADAPACAGILGDFFETTTWLPRLHSPQEDMAFLTGLIARADVTVAEVTGADVTGADVTGADVTGADVTGADVTGADVTGAEAQAILGYIARDGHDLLHLYLAPQARRQGIGSRLLQFAKTRQRRLTLWCFAQNQPALAFYAQHGFVERARTAGTDTEERLPDIKLEWRVA